MPMMASRKASSPRALTASILSLRDDIGALPVIAAVERHHHLAGVEPRKQVFALIGALAGAKPQHVHRRADVLDLETGALPHDRMPAVAADGEVGADFDDPSGVLAFTPMTASPDRIRSVASTSIITLSDGNRLPLSRRKLRKSHCGMKAMKGYFVVEATEVRDADRRLAELAVHGLQPLVRQFQKSIDQAEFVHHLQRRGMHGVAAKIPEEVGVLFQHHDVDPGAAQQIAQHHAGGTAADDAAARGDGAR